MKDFYTFDSKDRNYKTNFLFNETTRDDESSYSPSHNEKCMYCGFEIFDTDDVLKVIPTGDIIHKKCWIDYAEDNIYDICEEYY